MQRQFQDILVEFYQTIMRKQPFSDLLTHSLERYLSYVEIQDENNKLKEKASEQMRSMKSGNSSLSNDSYTRLKKLFHTSKLETAMLFAYFLHMVKLKKTDQINAIFKNLSVRLKQYDRFISQEQKKKFSTKISGLNQSLLFLSSRAQAGCQIDWPFYQMFEGFEGQCLLFTRLLSSLGETLETQQNINSNDYMIFCGALQIKCFVYDYQKKMPFELGTGDLKIYLGNKSDTYFIHSEKQFQMIAQASRKELRANQTKPSAEEKGLRELKKYPAIKFKEEFLAEMTKLKQEYEQNTSKIASLFSFKDSTQESQNMGDEFRVA